MLFIFWVNLNFRKSSSTGPADLTPRPCRTPPGLCWRGTRRGFLLTFRQWRSRSHFDESGPRRPSYMKTYGTCGFDCKLVTKSVTLDVQKFVGYNRVRYKRGFVITEFFVPRFSCISLLTLISVKKTILVWKLFLIDSCRHKTAIFYSLKESSKLKYKVKFFFTNLFLVPQMCFKANISHFTYARTNNILSNLIAMFFF
jgi:hypothetical protein